jgi:glycosyltransferase involved in cell wall biosynthesis
VYIAAHNGTHFFGGGEKWTVQTLAGLQRRGHRVRLFCRGSAVARPAAEYGVPTQVLRLGGEPLLPQALYFAAVMRLHAPDVLLLTTPRKVWLGSMGARLARVPRIVVRVGWSKTVLRRWTYRVALRRWVHAVVLNADTMRAPLLAAAPDLDPRRVVTIYNGVSEPKPLAPPGVVRRSLGLPPDAMVVGTLTRFHPDKRVDRLLHALALLPENVHCVVAGDGPLRPSVERLAADLGLASRVHLLGHRKDVWDVLDAFDLSVISSDAEGMANAMLESMSAGVPVLTTPVSGAAEALEPSPDGTAPGEIVGFDAGELAAAIRRLLADPERLRKMGAAGVQRARERFDFDSMLDHYEELFASLPQRLGCERAAACV